MVAQSGSCGVFRDVADEAPILLFAAHNVVIGLIKLESPGEAHEFVDFAGRCAFNALQDPRKVMASQWFHKEVNMRGHDDGCVKPVSLAVETQ